MVDLRRIYTVGTKLELEFRKWDDRLHYVWPAIAREVFADRVHLMSPAGTVFHHITRQKQVTLDHDAHLAFWVGRWYSGGPDFRPGSDEVIEYYFNINTPPEFRTNCIRAVDLEIDLKVKPDLSVTVFDEEEFEVARQRYSYPAWLMRQVQLAVDEVHELIDRGSWPFLAAQAVPDDFRWMIRE